MFIKAAIIANGKMKRVDGPKGVRKDRSDEFEKGSFVFTISEFHNTAHKICCVAVYQNDFTMKPVFLCKIHVIQEAGMSGQAIDITTLPVEQLGMIIKQLEEEIQILQTSFSQLKSARSAYTDTVEALESVTPKHKGVK
eukprot:TRINITY_DN2132_c0_g1_i26.p1 TRINITY_DN2132_c0_g1~~TRINITY_DN2132_c0_g1_i26.p1  ORF type:complete len:139 (-),score=22.96 TRINITY_DN2132_c0_g1_i26:212-628(-)